MHPPTRMQMNDGGAKEQDRTIAFFAKPRDLVGGTYCLPRLISGVRRTANDVPMIKNVRSRKLLLPVIAEQSEDVRRRTPNTD